MAQNMKLFAAGFNAWNQLSFDRPHNPDDDDEPHDLAAFTDVLQGRYLGLPTISQDGELRKAGSGYPEDESEIPTGVENALGEVLVAEKHPPTLCKLPPDGAEWACTGRPSQIAAWDAGWVVLYEDGRVDTMGDARFEACLGREITEDSPADCPGRVDDLDEPVKRVAAGSYTVVALTLSGSLYAWGMESPGTHRRRQAIPDLSDVPNYIDVDGDIDIDDVAVGESHAIVLADNGSVYVIGGNENGQLGLGLPFSERAQSWTRVDLDPGPGYRVVRVAAGPRTSFILVAADGS